jgi:hypothetical protein
MRSYIQWWSVIKNSAEDISDKRAIDAFPVGLHRSDLVEEVGRTKPRTVSKLMKVANRFTDEEDAYNNKRGRSPEVDRASRQRRRYRNGDSHARQNQIAAGYERRDEEGYENREFQTRSNHLAIPVIPDLHFIGSSSPECSQRIASRSSRPSMNLVNFSGTR